MNPIEFIGLFTNSRILDNRYIFKLDSKFFLGDSQTAELLQKPATKPVYFKTYLGTEGRVFVPSFFLLELLKTHAQTAVINTKSEWLFLCRRDILGEGVIKSGRLQEKEHVLVLNERSEVLGYGYYVGGKIRNLLDRGDFLRRERNNIRIKK